jgi:hypothetical protein
MQVQHIYIWVVLLVAHSFVGSFILVARYFLFLLLFICVLGNHRNEWLEEEIHFYMDASNYFLFHRGINS